MAGKSSIEWTNATWNPVTGCTKISQGCQNCYAERMAHRLQAMGNPNYSEGFKVVLHNHVLKVPISWKRARTIFVNSMSDLFHEDVPVDFIKEVFDVIKHCPQHTFQILTKRADRLREVSTQLIWPHNAWMGVTVESSDYMYRIDELRDTPAKVKFLSLEPLLSPMPNIKFKNIDWVIVGGESGPRARAMEAEWVKDIRDQCAHTGVPFFFKQWGGFNKKKAGRLLDGQEWNEMPDLQQIAS